MKKRPMGAFLVVIVAVGNLDYSLFVVGQLTATVLAVEGIAHGRSSCSSDT